MKKEIGAGVDATFPGTVPTSTTVWNWMNLFEEGNLTYDRVKEYWMSKIRTLCVMPAPESSLHCFDSLGGTSVLIEELEDFIYNGDKEVVNESIKRHEKDPVMCAKAFRSGEPSYNCRECSVDSTCVLCTDCFRKSQHRFHKYRMATSAGGGYCDCGDKEAWKNYVFCEMHFPSEHASENTFSFPPDVFMKSKSAFSFALQFSHDVISKHFKVDQEFDQEALENPNYLVLLYNDEVHTYDHVISLLTDIIKCTTRQAVELASKINKVGRGVIASTDFYSCCRIKTDIERRSSFESSHTLEVHIVSFTVMAYQCFALEILTWIQNLLNLSSGFRLAFVQALQEPNPSLATPLLLDRILVQDPFLWKSVRMKWNTLLCSGFLLEYESKITLAIRFINNFSLIMKNYLNDEEDHIFSSAALSVQLFTVPSIAQTLIASHKALEVVSDFLLSVITSERDSQGKLAFGRTRTRAFERASYILFDLRYLLSSPPTTWDVDMREGFCSGISSFWEFLSCVEGMNAVTRQLGEHLEYEPEWETSFSLLQKMSHVFHLLDQWFRVDKEVLVREYVTVVNKIKSITSSYSYEEFQVGTITAKCIKFDPTVDPVSIHIPLTRFWANLYLQLAEKELSFSSKELNFPDQLSPFELIEPAVRIQAICSQFRVGMWKKNGHSLVSQMFYYHDSKFRAVMYDMDITLLQIGASLVSSDEFLINVLYKFGIHQWNPHELGQEEPDINQKWSLVDEFLHLIIILVTERYQMEVGQVSSKDCLKYKIVHLLALQPLPYSEIIKPLSMKSPLTEEIEELINDVASFKTAGTATDKGLYELKEEFLKTLNIFFYHFSREQSFQTEQTQRAYLKKITGSDFCPPQSLPPFTPPFVKVPSLLRSQVMLHIMHMVCSSWVKVEGHATLDGHLHKVLFLMGLALAEEESVAEFSFTEQAKKWELDLLLVSVYRCSWLKDHRNLAKWVMQKFATVAQDDLILNAIVEYDKEHQETPQQQSVVSKAEQARAKIMADMKAKQVKFLKQNPHAFQTLPCTMVTNVCSEPPCKAQASERLICILCQEEEVVSMEGRMMVYAAFVQLSTVHLKQRQSSEGIFSDLKSIYLTSNTGPSPYVSTCGHSMHADCWESWRLEVIRRRASGSNTPSSSHDTEKSEFLCALCQCISNAVLPILPSHDADRSDISTDQNPPDFSFIQWLKISLKVLHIIQLSKSSTSTSVDQLGAIQFSINDDGCEHSEDSSSKHDEVQPVTISLSAQSQPSTSGCLVAGTLEDHPGFNVECEKDFVLNIKRYNQDASLRQFEMNSFELPLDKITWIHSLAVSIQGVVSNHSQHQSSFVSRNPSLTWMTLAYTIHSVECNLRYNGKPLGSLTPREKICLENLTKISQVLGISRYQRINANQSVLKILNVILHGEYSQESILDVDCFSLLIVLLMGMPNILDSKELYFVSPSVDNFILRLILISHIAQILMTVDLPTTNNSSEDQMSSETICLSFLVSRVRNHHSFFNTDMLWEIVKEKVKPFLRRCYILFLVHPVRNPTNYEELEDDTYETLCSVLALPVSCRELLDDEVTQSLFMMWAQHPKVQNSLEGKIRDRFKDLSHINRLVSLPEDYSELLSLVQSFSCPNSDIDDSRVPTMCLVCGKILCSLSYCCQTELNQQKVGACTYHSYECGGGSGLFLQLRECQVLMFAGYGMGSLMTPPYLDDHDEPDQGLRRGNKLRLNERCYRKLEQTWLSHKIYEEVARKLDSTGVNIVRCRSQFF